MTPGDGDLETGQNGQRAAIIPTAEANKPVNSSSG